MNLIKKIENKHCFFITFIFLFFTGFTSADQLLPADNQETGWSFEPDLGWIYIVYSNDQGTWFWVENNPFLVTQRNGEWILSKWIFSAEQYYPFYWDETDKEWCNINRTILGRVYDRRYEENYIIPYTSYTSIEAYITDAYEVNDTGPQFIQLTFYSETGVGIDIGNNYINELWTFIQDRSIITGSPLIGDYPFYNPYTEILFADGMKFKKQLAVPLQSRSKRVVTPHKLTPIPQ